MTFLEEINSLKEIGEAAKEKQRITHLEQYNKQVATLGPAIQTTLNHVKDEIKTAARNGRSSIYVEAPGGGDSRFIYNETSKILEQEGLKIDRSYMSFYTGAYRFTVSF